MNSGEDEGAVGAPETDREGIAWLNVPRALSLARLAGRLAVLHFWAPSSVACLHVLETLRRLQAAFPTEAVVVGVHSPKFAAEREPGRLRRAVARLGIAHPVAHDPELQLWRAYAVSAWPTLVLVSPDGYVLGHVSGEPDGERLITAVAELVETWEAQERLRPRPVETRSEPAAGGRLRFPARLKPVPGDARRWALADAGHHQVVLLDDGGGELARYGAGAAGFVDGPAAEAAFRSPQGLATDGEAVYVADTGNHAIRRIALAGGAVTTLAGTGEPGMVLDEGEPALATALSSPRDLEADGGRLYVANAGTHQIAALDLRSRRLSRLAGNGVEDIVDGPAAEAQLAQPSGLGLDEASGRLVFVDAATSALRVVELAGGAPRVATLVGRGPFDFGHLNGALAEALLQQPLGVAAWGGRLLVADTYNDALRIVDPAAGRLDDLEIAGADGPPAGPVGVAADGRESVLLVDTDNHRVLKVRPRERRSAVWLA